MGYKATLEALRGYAPKRLIMGFLRNEAGCCALGAACPDPAEEAFAVRGAGAKAQREASLRLVRAARERLGLTQAELAILLRTNDLEYASGEVRYEAVLAWLEEQAAREPATGGSR